MVALTPKPDGVAATVPSFDRPTDKWGKRPAWKADEVEEHRNLEETFREWADEKSGAIWWDTETRLADAIARVLGIEIDWTDRG